MLLLKNIFVLIVTILFYQVVKLLIFFVLREKVCRNTRMSSPGQRTQKQLNILKYVVINLKKF